MAYTTIDKPTDYFNTVTWTGDGSSSRNITGVGFQPDWVWGKCRNATVSHALYDSVRGGSKLLNSNATSAEGTNAALSAFVSDGFSVNSDSYFNLNNNTYVAWNWLAGGSASSNSDGGITTSVSANTTSGFSIVKWTGNGSATTLGHGLGSVPKVLFLKTLDRSENWVVYHVGNDAAAPEDKSIRLDGTNAVQDNATHFNDTAPTSSVFSVGASNGVNPSGEEMIAYCFAEKQGFSKIGSYEGSGDADGPLIYTGMSTAFVLIKEIDNANNWMIYDNKRSPFNLRDDFISPDIADAEYTGNANNRMDMLSNGFKIRGTGSATNRSGSTYIYMSFAESPFVSSGGTPTTAR